MRTSYDKVSDAHREIAQAREAIAFMNATLSGCDWCDDCGGGAKAVWQIACMAERAERFLLSVGVTPVCWCDSCGYHQVAADQEGFCEKCEWLYSQSSEKCEWL